MSRDLDLILRELRRARAELAKARVQAEAVIAAPRAEHDALLREAVEASSQSAVARAFGVSQQAISKHLNKPQDDQAAPKVAQR